MRTQTFLSAEKSFFHLFSSIPVPNPQKHLTHIPFSTCLILNLPSLLSSITFYPSFLHLFHQFKIWCPFSLPPSPPSLPPSLPPPSLTGLRSSLNDAKLVLLVPQWSENICKVHWDHVDYQGREALNVLIHHNSYAGVTFLRYFKFLYQCKFRVKCDV